MEHLYLAISMDQLSRQQYMIERYNEFIQYKMSHEDALYVIRLMFELNALGFERYISDYFHKRDGYATKVVGGWNDHGIDIEGSKTIGHRSLHLAIQCKKRYYPHIPVKKDKILEFDDNVKRRGKTHNNTQSFFVTTTNASKEAKRVAQEKGIAIRDCWDLIRMRDFYSLDAFMSNSRKWNNNGDRLFTPDNPSAVIHNYLNGKRRIFYPNI